MSDWKVMSVICVKCGVEFQTRDPRELSIDGIREYKIRGYCKCMNWDCRHEQKKDEARIAFNFNRGANHYD